MDKIRIDKLDSIVVIGTGQDNIRTLEQLSMLSVTITLLPLPFNPTAINDTSDDDFYTFLANNSLDANNTTRIICCQNSEYADILISLFDRIGNYHRNENIYLIDNFIAAYIDMLNRQILTLQDNLAGMVSENDNLQNQLTTATLYSNALLNSTSWRITKPLRMIRQVFGGSR
jgi:hypothetical protein